MWHHALLRPTRNKERRNKMKQLESTGQMGEVDLYLPFQDVPFTVTGDYDYLQSTYGRTAATEAQIAQTTERAARVSKVAQTAATIVTAPIHGLAEHVKTETKVGLYDMVHGTQFRKIMKEQRDLRRDTAFAQRIGIVGIDRCAKHERAMRAVQNIR